MPETERVSRIETTTQRGLLSKAQPPTAAPDNASSDSEGVASPQSLIAQIGPEVARSSVSFSEARSPPILPSEMRRCESRLQNRPATELDRAFQCCSIPERR